MPLRVLPGLPNQRAALQDRDAAGEPAATLDIPAGGHAAACRSGPYAYAYAGTAAAATIGCTAAYAYAYAAAYAKAGRVQPVGGILRG